MEKSDAPLDYADASWYVLYTKPQKELFVYSILTDRKKVVAYLPEVLQPYRGRVQMRPLFPRYLFVQLDLEMIPASMLNHMPGAVKLVSCDGKPLPLRPDIVKAIQEEVARLNASGGLPMRTFNQGELVRLRSGPLAGMEVVFVKHLSPRDRAIVLLRFLGQENQIEVDLAAIEPTCRRRVRGTRGRGRRIFYED